MAMRKFGGTRTERDALGEITVPFDALYGAQTERALRNFPISGIAISQIPSLISALATIKKAAATANARLGHLSVEDILASADQVTSLGGKILRAPAKQGDFGTMAIAADPQGGAFVLWQSARPQSSGDFKGEPGWWVWNELYAQEPEKSLEFYSKLGGYTHEKMDMKDGAYHILHRDGKGRAGVLKPPMPMPQAWMPYVQVASTDDAIAKAKRLGANVHVAGEDIPIPVSPGLERGAVPTPQLIAETGLWLVKRVAPSWAA